MTTYSVGWQSPEYCTLINNKDIKVVYYTVNHTIFDSYIIVINNYQFHIYHNRLVLYKNNNPAVKFYIKKELSDFITIIKSPFDLKISKIGKPFKRYHFDNEDIIFGYDLNYVKNQFDKLEKLVILL